MRTWEEGRKHALDGEGRRWFAGDAYNRGFLHGRREKKDRAAYEKKTGKKAPPGHS